MNVIKEAAFERSSVLEDAKHIALMLSAAALLPVLFHLIPPFSGVPSGARFLPIFYAPFMGIVLYRPRVGIVAGILAPALNTVITGRPEPDVLLMLTAELAVFAVLAAVIYSFNKDLKWNAPVSYIAAKLVSAVILRITPSFAGDAEGIRFFLQAIVTGAPGIVMLFAVNWVTLIWRNKKPHERT